MFIGFSAFVAAESAVVFGFGKFVDVVVEPAYFGGSSAVEFGDVGLYV